MHDSIENWINTVQRAAFASLSLKKQTLREEADLERGGFSIKRKHCILRAIKPEGSHFQEITETEKEAKLFGELGDTTNELCNDFP